MLDHNSNSPLETSIVKRRQQMGVLTTSRHEYWATISGSSLQDILQQEETVRQWGVTAVEFRADLIPPPIYSDLLARRAWSGPTFVAHFGVGVEAKIAHDAIVRAIDADVFGGICHSRCELAMEIRHACLDAGKQFAAAYHSQEPMTCAEALREFEQQEVFQPLFRKIAVRAHRFEDALAIVEATHEAAISGGSPVIGAVFGPHRWARVVLPHAGSSVSFILAHQVANEVGKDDEQLQVIEVNALQSIRGLFPPHSGELEQWREPTHPTRMVAA